MYDFHRDGNLSKYAIGYGKERKIALLKYRSNTAISLEYRLLISTKEKNSTTNEGKETVFVKLVSFTKQNWIVHEHLHGAVCKSKGGRYARWMQKA